MNPIGHPRSYSSPEEFWNAAVEYFDWCVNNPLYEEKAFAYMGSLTFHEKPKMRAMTIMGFSIFAGFTSSTFSDYAKRAEFANVCSAIKEITTTQKFEGAAADLLNASIIALDLGLKDNDLKINEPIQVNVVRAVRAERMTDDD